MVRSVVLFLLALLLSVVSITGVTPFRHWLRLPASSPAPATPPPHLDWEWVRVGSVPPTQCTTIVWQISGVVRRSRYGRPSALSNGGDARAVDCGVPLLMRCPEGAARGWRGEAEHQGARAPPPGPSVTDRRHVGSRPRGSACHVGEVARRTPSLRGQHAFIGWVTGPVFEEIVVPNIRVYNNNLRSPAGGWVE